jgi:hypothetical protein
VDPETREQRHHEVSWDALPDGTFVLEDGRPWLVLGAELLEWTPAGYVAARRTRPSTGTALALTPPSLIEVLRSGWASAAVPLLHPTATG